MSRTIWTKVGELGREMGSGSCYLAFSLTLSFPHRWADIGALVFLLRWPKFLLTTALYFLKSFNSVTQQPSVGSPL